MYLYKVETQSSVLINQGVLISEVFFKRGSTVYLTLAVPCKVVSSCFQLHNHI